jgi:hypothetical protein
MGWQVIVFTRIIVSRQPSAAHISALANIVAGISILWLVACYTHAMSKRLQVLLADEEMSDFQLLAQREHLTLGEWVRRTLREARKNRSVKDPAAKLAAIRRAVEYSSPVPAVDIDQMLREIEQGYLSDLH